MRFFCAFFLLTVLTQKLSAQSLEITEKPKFEIGLSTQLMSYDFGSRLGIETALLYNFKKSWYGSVKFLSDFDDAHSLKLGFRKGIIEKGRFRLLTGIDFVVDSYKNESVHNERLTHFGLELPVDLSIRLSKSTHVNIGATTSLGKTGYNTYKGRTPNYLIESIRLGFSKKF